MRHDVLASGLDRELKDHIILRITQKRAPKVVNLSMVSNAADEVDDIIDLSMGKPEVARMFLRDCFILQNQWDRDTDTETIRAQLAKECIGRAARRP